jgi:CheY-like chemotaxis protein
MAERRVLVVDDDRDILDMMSLVLTSAGYVVRTSTDGAAALAVLEEGFAPGLILLDLMMPGMDGWTFREKQLADPRTAGIPVIVCSGDPRALHRSLPPGVEKCLRKPIPLESLLQEVGSFVS